MKLKTQILVIALGLAASTSLVWSADKQLSPEAGPAIVGVWEVTRHGVNCNDPTQEGPPFPSDVAVASSLDTAAAWRSLRAAEARFGPVILGEPIAGDGSRSATWRLRGERGDVDMSLELDETGQAVQTVAFIPVSLEMPPDAF